MKITCLNEACLYTEKIELDNLNAFDLEKPFIACPECNELAVIVKNNFTFENKESLYLCYLKVLHKEKKEKNV